MATRSISSPSLLDVTVTVAGRPWRRVVGLTAEAPAAGSYAVVIAPDGSAQVAFGNGVHGQRPPAGAEITVAYKSGGGRDGNVGRVAPLAGGVSGLMVALPLKPVEVSPRETRRRWPPW
jgi:hypothetical protein